jgi:hypothetical protein
VGGMVEVVEMQDYSFIGRWRYKPPHEYDSDESSEENENTMEEQLASIQE